MTGHGGIRRVPGRWIALKGRTLGTRQILSFRVSQDCDLRRPVVDSVADETARIWDAATGQLRATLTGHTEEVKAVAIAPDGAWLATTSGDQTVRVWDTVSGDISAVMRVDSPLRDCTWNPSGRHGANKRDPARLGRPRHGPSQCQLP